MRVVLPCLPGQEKCCTSLLSPSAPSGPENDCCCCAAGRSSLELVLCKRRRRCGPSWPTHPPPLAVAAAAAHSPTLSSPTGPRCPGVRSGCGCFSTCVAGSIHGNSCACIYLPSISLLGRPVQSNFHAASPAALAAIRLHLVAAPADGAAAVLLRELDFAPVLAKVRAEAQPQPAMHCSPLASNSSVGPQCCTCLHARQRCTPCATGLSPASTGGPRAGAPASAAGVQPCG